MFKILIYSCDYKAEFSVDNDPSNMILQKSF